MSTRKSTPGFSSPSISRINTGWADAATVALAFLLSACAGSRAIPEPNAKHLEFAERNGYATTLVSLKNGRRLYVNRCSSCHTLHNPSAFSAKEWPTLVQDMATNAEINEDQVRDITRYVVAVAAAAQDTLPPRPLGTRDSTGSMVK